LFFKSLYVFNSLRLHSFDIRYFTHFDVVEQFQANNSRFLPLLEIGHVYHQVLLVDKLGIQSGLVARIKDHLELDDLLLEHQVFVDLLFRKQELLDVHFLRMEHIKLKPIHVAVEIVSNAKVLWVCLLLFQGLLF
jgi:hypothetical protein